MRRKKKKEEEEEKKKKKKKQKEENEEEEEEGGGGGEEEEGGGEEEEEEEEGGGGGGGGGVEGQQGSSTFSRLLEGSLSLERHSRVEPQGRCCTSCSSSSSSSSSSSCSCSRRFPSSFGGPWRRCRRQPRQSRGPQGLPGPSVSAVQHQRLLGAFHAAEAFVALKHLDRSGSRVAEAQEQHSNSYQSAFLQLEFFKAPTPVAVAPLPLL